MSSTPAPGESNPPQSQADEAQPSSTPLPLPEPPSATSPTHQLTVDGAGVKLDHLGPLVVNVDGTMSRIANWDKMADIERENTLRIIGKRNQARLAKLREASGAETETETGTGTGTGTQ